MKGYFEPFTYQPMMRYYYQGTALPQAVSKLIDQNPAAANHLQAVHAFIEWLKRFYPAIYSAANAKNPALLDPGKVVLSGRIAPSSGSSVAPSNLKGLRGFGALRGSDDYLLNEQAGPVIITELPTAGGTSGGSGWMGAVSDWGRQIADIVKLRETNAYQKRILDENIRRAEKGLPPLDMQGIAPQVNFGLSPGVTQLAYLAVGGLVLAGVLSAFRRKG